MNEDMRSITGNSWVVRGVAASLVLLAAFLAIQTLSLMKSYQFIGGGVPATNTVTVSGEGEVFAIPDIATFTFSVFEEASTVEMAQETATQKANDLIAFLKRENVEDKDIKTVGYNVNPHYEYRRLGASEPPVYPPQGERTLVGFEVRQTIEVKVRDTQKAGELLSGIGGRGVSDISGLQFTIEDEDTLKAEARKSAIADAEAKGKQLARDLGVKLVRVVSFSESDQGFYPRAFAVGVGGDASSVAEKVVPQIPIGENKILSNVSITYEIR